MKEDFEIEIDHSMAKELNIMCNLSEGIAEEAYERAWSEATKLSEGIAEEAREDAKKEQMIEVTVNMLKEKISTDVISRITNLSMERIAEIGKLHGVL